MICLYNKNETSFTDNGVCVLSPSVCTVKEVAGGLYELYMEHPIDNEGKSSLLVEEMIVKAPVPPMTVPAITLPEVKLFRTNKATDLYSKLPVTSYPPAVDSDIKIVQANPSGFAWRSGRVYMIGDLAVDGDYIYRCKESNYSCSPHGNPELWGVAASVNAPVPTYDPGVVTETLANNEIVSKIADYSAQWVQVRSLRGNVGYIARADCDDTTETEAGEVIPSHEITEQAFRIYRVESEDDQHIVRVNARHISYDFKGNALYDCKIQEAEPMTAIAIMKGSLMIEDDRIIASDITDKTVSQDWSFRNPVNALLDPSTGLVKAIGARLIRDNKDFYLLDSANAPDGITLSYGVNLRGVRWTRDIEGIITRVVPRCSDEADGYLYITDGGAIVNGAVRNDGEMWVDSSVASQYSFIRIEVLDCMYKVGEEYEKPDGTKETRTKASCQSLMKQDAL